MCASIRACIFTKVVVSLCYEGINASPTHLTCIRWLLSPQVNSFVRKQQNRMAHAMGEGTEQPSEDPASCSSDASTTTRVASQGTPSPYWRRSCPIHPVPSAGSFDCEVAALSSSSPRVAWEPSPGSAPVAAAAALGEATVVAEGDETALEDFAMPDIDEAEAWALLDVAMLERAAFLERALQERMVALFAPEGGDAELPPGEQLMGKDSGWADERTDVVGFGTGGERAGKGDGDAALDAQHTEMADKLLDIMALEKAREEETERQQKQQQAWRQEFQQQPEDADVVEAQEEPRSCSNLPAEEGGESKQNKQGTQEAASVADQEQANAFNAVALEAAPVPSQHGDKSGSASEPSLQQGCLDWMFPGRRGNEEECERAAAEEVPPSGLKPRPPLLAFTAVGGMNKRLRDMTAAERHRSLVQLQFEVCMRLGSLGTCSAKTLDLFCWRRGVE